VDFIGIDAYYKLSDKLNPTLEELIAGWQPWVENSKTLSAKFGKKIIFTELGYTSVDGVAQKPFSWDLPGEVDMQEQKDCYESFFKAVYNQPWFEGVVFWSWRIFPDESENAKRDFSPEHKPAGELVNKWFHGRAGK